MHHKVVEEIRRLNEKIGQLTLSPVELTDIHRYTRRLGVKKGNSFQGHGIKIRHQEIGGWKVSSAF